MNILELETPCFIVCKEKLCESIVSFKQSLNKYFPKNILSYSLKTNSFPYILNQIQINDGYAEVVSHDEYEMAMACKFSKKNIVYNGPLKSQKTFIEALENGAIVNIETKQEISWLKYLSKDRRYNIGIRVNIDLATISLVDAKENEDYSRFGFSFENGELGNAIKKIKKFPNVQLSGLHVHRTTASRSVNAYRKIAEYVANITNELNLSLDYIDIGGGFYGIMENKPTFDEYCNEIRRGLEKCFDLSAITIIVEPGNAIIASGMDFLSSVLDVKKIRNFYIITTDGSRNDVDPFYKKKNYFNEFIRLNPFEAKKVDLQVISGGTCLEYDKLFEMRDQSLLSVGDKILYKSVGAYTMALSPLFIRYFPAVYIEQGNEYELARNKWSASMFFNICDTLK